MAAVGVDAENTPLSIVREQCHRFLTARVDDAAALSIATAAACIESEGLLEVHCDGQVQTDALRHRVALALAQPSFDALYASSAVVFLRREASLAQIRAFFERPEAAALLTRAEAALAATLVEAEPKARWTRAPGIKLAAFVALFREHDPDHKCLESVLGGLVAADKRTLEDLKADVEDEQVDVLLLSDAIRVLASCVVA